MQYIVQENENLTATGSCSAPPFSSSQVSATRIVVKDNDDSSEFFYDNDPWANNLFKDIEHDEVCYCYFFKTKQNQDLEKRKQEIKYDTLPNYRCAIGKKQFGMNK